MIELTEKQKRFIARTRDKVTRANKLKSVPNPHWDKKTEHPVGMGKDGKLIVVSDKQRNSPL